jgi:hypothetical protein
MNGFLAHVFSRTGRAGIMIDIGKKTLGASRAITLDHKKRDRD